MDFLIVALSLISGQVLLVDPIPQLDQLVFNHPDYHRFARIL